MTDVSTLLPETDLDRYAELVLTVGVHVQPQDGLILIADVAHMALVRRLVARAYDLGAKDVVFVPRDDALTRARFDHGHEVAWSTCEPWAMVHTKTLYENGYQLLRIVGDDPHALAGVAADRLRRYTLASDKTSQAVGLRAFTMTGRTRWCLAAMPSVGWAKTVFPNDPTDLAITKLFARIATAVRLDADDPASAWAAHNKRLHTARDFMQKNQFASLHFTAPGTDLSVDLAEDHMWMGGAKTSLSGVSYVANMPTEEIFTTPHRLRVDGVVTSTKPLSLDGTIVHDLVCTFEHGRLVDVKASTGLDTLLDHLARDEGARHLGEVALVERTSPIASFDTLFFNTLYDENAACHLAFGQSYGYAMKNGATTSPDALEAKGANRSAIHTDFMIGSPDMSVTATTQDHKAVPIMIQGVFHPAVLAG